MVRTAKLHMLKLASMLKTNKLLKLLFDIKANTSILMRLEMAGMVQNKQNALFSLWSLELK